MNYVFIHILFHRHSNKIIVSIPKYKFNRKDGLNVGAVSIILALLTILSFLSNIRKDNDIAKSNYELAHLKNYITTYINK